MNINIFNKLVVLLQENYNKCNYLDSIYLSKIIAKFASTHYTNCLNSNEIEYILNDISKNQIRTFEIDLNFLNNSNILHVFTATYFTGGHTRLAYNWIKNALDNEIHHVLLLEQSEKEIPLFLKEEILKRKGNIYSYKNENSIFKKAENLRSISKNFKYIILHLDMSDPMANLAFGYDPSKYPTIFVNHADHIFWLGSLSSNHYAELCLSGQEISYLKRNISSSSILPIALNLNEKVITKSSARNKLGLSPDTILYLSIGSPHKYIPEGNVDFYHVSNELMNRTNDKNTKLIIIGPDRKKDFRWQELYELTDGRIDAIGYITEELYLYHNACDIYLDCIPWGSYTATLEVAILGKPCVVLDYGFKRTIDSLIESNYVVNTIDEYIEVAIKFMNYNELNTKEIIESYHLKDGWRNYLNKLYYDMNNKIVYKYNKSEDEKDIIIKRFEEFSFNNLKYSNEYFFIKKIKKELKNISLLNKCRIILILSKNYKLKLKFKSFLYFLKGF